MMTQQQKVNLFISRRLAMKAVGYRLPRNRRVPRPLQPTGIEREYYGIILGLIDPFFKQVRERLIPVIPEIIRMYQEETRTDSVYSDAVISYGQMITRVIGDIRVNVARQITESEIKIQTERIGRRTAAFNKSQIDRQFKSVLGINPILSEQWLEPSVNGFVETNVSLINNVPDGSLGRIEQMVRATVEQGISTSDLQKRIIAEIGSTEKRVHFIARDQIAKYNGKLTEFRQKEAGVTKYIWSTSKDERVRPRHLAVDGESFLWSSHGAPVGSGGEKLHPGMDYQCRCIGLPVLDEFL